jgi:hypothetical protein
LTGELLLQLNEFLTIERIKPDIDYNNTKSQKNDMPVQQHCQCSKDIIHPLPE